MKRSREEDDTCVAISVKRLKEPPSHDNIKSYVENIHEALQGSALTTVNYVDDSSICMFSIKTPPGEIDMQIMENLLAIKNINFIVYKARKPRTIILQVQSQINKEVKDEVKKDEEKIMIIDGNNDERKIMRWVASISNFKYTIERINNRVHYIIKDDHHIEKDFFKDLNLAKNNGLFKNYKVYLSKNHVTIQFNP